MGTGRAKQTDAWIEDELLRCALDPVRFHDVVLARGYRDEHGMRRPARLWSRQVEALRSVKAVRQTAVKSGNGIGKTFMLATLALWAWSSHPDCKVVVSAPTLGQLQGAVWGEVAAGYRSAQDNGYPLGGRLRSLTLEKSESWRLECFGQGSVESKSGRHAGELFALIDEASGTPPEVDEAIDSLNPSRIFRVGNPLNPEGKFYEVCELSGDNPHINVITVPSTESPDIHLPRSPRGMADATWLEDMRHQYGEDSLWWASHVEARFPNSITDGLIPIPWLNLASQTIHVAQGDVWMGVDLGAGNGGDPSEIVCRDDNGIPRDDQGLAWESSNRWTLEQLADRVKLMQDRFGVDPSRIIYDANGIGVDFDNRLRAVGIHGARGYLGSGGAKGAKFLNLRAICHWKVRQRFDPNRNVRTNQYPGSRAIWVPQAPFALPKMLLDRYRAEMQGCTYHMTPMGLIAIEEKTAFTARLKKSPNFLDALSMTFAFPYA